MRDARGIKRENWTESRKAAAFFGFTANELYELERQGAVLRTLQGRRSAACLHASPGGRGGTGSILSNELDISNLRDRIVLPRVGGIDEDGTVGNPD